MKKLIAIVLCLIMAASLVTGCSSAAPVTEAPAAPQPAAEQSAVEAAPAAETAQTPTAEGAYDLTGCEPLKVVIATAGGAENIETVYTEKWMDLVSERTNGLVTFDYTNGGAMGSYAELLDGVNAGAYDMTVTDIGQFTMVPETTVPCMPFMMTSYDQLKKVFASDSEVFNWLQGCIESETNMKILNAYFCGFRDILSKDQLTSMSDFKGYLIRSPQVETYTDMFTILGFSYVTMGWSDTYSGMQTGIIDSVETALMSLYNTGFYNVGKYVLLTNHMQAVNTLVANQDFWKNMPEVYQRIMTDAIIEVQEAEWEQCISQEEYYKEQLQAEGVTVSEISAEDRASINEAFKSYWQEKAAQIGGSAPNMVAKINEMA